MTTRKICARLTGQLFGLCLLLPLLLPAASSPPVIYLTWQDDPARSMVIKWLATETGQDRAEWRLAGQTNWQAARSSPAVRLDSTWQIQGVALGGLRPAGDYEFRVPPRTNIFKFRTAAADLRQPVRFVQGGDLYYGRKVLDPVNALAGRFDPAFAVIGGDLAYSFTNLVEQTGRWVDYFASWMENAITPDGRMIPTVVTIGNHEVAGSWGKSPEQAQSFYNLFPLPGRRGYATLDFGRYLSLLLLDSGHTTPVAGPQTAWLTQALRERRRWPHVFPIYHVTAYPSYRLGGTNWSSEITRQIQTHWCPVFDRFNLPLAFEHHDHTFKRTHPLRAGKPDPRGTVYLGDGAWGVDPRKPKSPADLPYLAKSAALRHFYVVTLYPESRHVLAVDEHGRVFDELYQRVR